MGRGSSKVAKWRAALNGCALAEQQQQQQNNNNNNNSKSYSPPLGKCPAWIHRHVSILVLQNSMIFHVSFDALHHGSMFNAPLVGGFNLPKTYGGFLGHGGTPSHPFIDGIFQHKPWGSPMTSWKPSQAVPGRTVARHGNRWCFVAPNTAAHSARWRP